MSRRRLPNFLRESEAALLLTTAQKLVAAARGKSPSKLRAAYLDLIIVLTGFNTGLRVAELCALKIEELDLAQRSLMVSGGKGDKDRLIPIGPKLFRSLLAWIGERTTGYVFSAPKGTRLATRTVQVRIKALAKRAGILRRVTPHKLRHFFATSLLHKGADIMEIKELLGHENLATTMIYLSTDPKRLRGAVERL